MSSRSATDTINGYYYQFDKTILELLSLKKDDSQVVAEGIEDIDIYETDELKTIQCKYYEKTEYNHSVISKAIRFMLLDFKKYKESETQKKKYFLYGHFKCGHEKLIMPVTIVFLKNHFFTFKENKKLIKYHEVLGLSDDDLEEFNEYLEIDINAKKIEAQFEEVIAKIKGQFSCTDFEAENYYYNNALSEVIRLASHDEELKRKITKKEFLAKINKKEILFNRWFLELKGKKNHLKNIKQQYFSGSLNISPFDRFFIIDCSESNNIAEIKDVILTIASRWSKLTKRTTQPYSPYIYLHNVDNSILVNLKTELYNEGHLFRDGHIFKDSQFFVNDILIESDFYNKIKFKIINNINDLTQTLEKSDKTKEIYQFYLDMPFFTNDSIKHVKIQVSDLSDIKEVV